MSDFEKAAALAAVVFSIGVHLLGLLAFVLLLASGAMQRATARVAVPDEHVLVRPEMLLVEEAPAPELRFVKGSRPPAAEPVPEAMNISNVDSRAASLEVFPDVVPEEEIAADGEVEHGMAVVDQDFADAPDEGALEAATGSRPPAPEPVQPEIPEQLPSESTESWMDLLRVEEEDAIVLSKESEQVEQRPPVPEQSSQPSRQQADTGYVHETRKRRLRGTLSNQGAPSFDAKATPTGKYLAQVTREIERRWRAQVDLNREFVTFATMRVTFRIDKQGMVHGLQISRAEANAVIKDFTLSAILEAELPPIPADLWEILEGEQIEMSYDIVIY